MPNKHYQSIPTDHSLTRRNFLKSSAISAGLLLGSPKLWAQEKTKKSKKPKTNLNEVINIPRQELSVPGRFPGKVLEVAHKSAMKDDTPDAKIVSEMVHTGIQKLTDKSLEESFGLFFKQDDIIGIKVNPVGAGLISTRLEVVDAVIEWLLNNGVPKKNIIIWDRFDYMLEEAGFTGERYPGIAIEGLQTMDESAAEEKSDDNSRWLDENGNHISIDNFDKDVYYWADVDGPEDMAYLNQHVVNGKYSYFGKLLTQKLTKIINVPVFKNTGNGISMATKNIGYGAVCNTGRLHKPLFFDVCTEIFAFPAIRDKLVLNITDGLRAQYDGGPGPNAQFTYNFNKLFFATDPFALDMICHQQMVEKRKSMDVKVNEHPIFTEYLHYAEKLGLGIANTEKIEHVEMVLG